MANLKGVLKCTQEQYNKLLAGETITIGDKTYTYDENVLYTTEDDGVAKQQTYFVNELPTATSSPYAEHDLVVVNNQTVYALEKVNDVLTWIKKYITAPFDYVKFETLTNGDGSKEDKIVITDPDASFNIVHENGSSTANIAISKGFTEMAVVDTLGSSRVSLSGNAVTMTTQGQEEANKMQVSITPEDAKLNNKSIEQRYLDLTGDSGTLDAGQYTLVTTYDDLIIRISGVTYRQQSKPINGSGDYIFVSRYYKQATSTTTKEKDDYIVVIKTDKTWSLIVDKDNGDNAILFTQAQTLTQEQKNTACSNMGISQSYEQTEADNAVIIRNGNIVKQMATFTVAGNAQKIWSFPYSYDTGKKPMVWVNSVAEGNSVGNGAAVISWNETSMTVRSCGVESQVTFYAEGWITKK